MINFASSLNRKSNIKYVWDKMKTVKKSFNTIDWRKWQNKDRRATILEEINKIAPLWVEQRNEIEEEEEKARDERNVKEKEEDLNLPFKEEELERALRNVKESSSPGIDRIEYKMIKKLSPGFKGEILKLFNWCFINGRQFRKWNEHQTIFIDKGNKEKIRPIAMSSCMEKVLERLMNERLVWWAEKNGKIYKNQNSFRRGKLCVDNLVRITADIQNYDERK